MTVEVQGIKVITDVPEAVRKLEQDTEIAYDCETTGLNPWQDHIATMQFYGKDTDTLAVLQLQDGIVPDAIQNLFQPHRTFTVHNGVGFDMLLLGTHAVPWRRAKWYDTLVGETVVVGSNRRDVSVSLRASVRRRLGFEIDKDIEHGHWHEQLSDRQIEYAAQDVTSLFALRLSQEQRAIESKQDGALKMEQELAPIIAQMTLNGVPVRPEVVLEYREEMLVRADKAEKELYDLFGKINLNSVPQLKTALAKRGVHVDSTAKEVLWDAVYSQASWAPLAQLILDYRFPKQRLKMYSPEWIDKFIVGDRVHPRFWQCSTDTGRMSCTDPNFQQVPRDGRKIVGNEEGMTIVSCDYSQIEVRIAAWAARDKALIELLEYDDVHRAVWSRLFKIPPEQVTKEQRKHAKAMSFLLLFGGSPEGLHDYIRGQGDTTTTLEETTEMYNAWFQTFQGLFGMQQYAKRLSHSPKPVYIRMPNGLRRTLVGSQRTPQRILNTTVQGTAAVGIKYGILECDRAGLMDYIGLQVHDELVAAVPDKEAEEFGRCMSEAMIAGMKKVLPIKVAAEVKSGKVWQP